MRLLALTWNLSINIYGCTVFVTLIGRRSQKYAGNFDSKILTLILIKQAWNKKRKKNF